jgi:hypothetical protein
MKATSIRQYRKRETGKMVFVYQVSGTPEELAAYKTAKGEHYREDKDTKAILMFSNRYTGKSVDLIKTEKGDYVPDTTEFDQLANLSDQYGIDIALRIAGKQAEVEA